MMVSAVDEVLERIEDEEDETEFETPPWLLQLLPMGSNMTPEEVEGDGELGETAKVPALLRSEAAEDR